MWGDFVAEGGLGCGEGLLGDELVVLLLTLGLQVRQSLGIEIRAYANCFEYFYQPWVV